MVPILSAARACLGARLRTALGRTCARSAPESFLRVPASECHMRHQTILYFLSNPAVRSHRISHPYTAVPLRFVHGTLDLLEKRIRTASFHTLNSWPGPPRTRLDGVVLRSGRAPEEIGPRTPLHYLLLDVSHTKMSEPNEDDTFKEKDAAARLDA